MDELDPRGICARRQCGAGTAIIFRNRDDIPHVVVSAKGEFRSKPLDTDDTFEFTFAKDGTYGYFCDLHAGQDHCHAVKRKGSSSPREHCGPVR